jgi:hypothetical protein
VYFVCFVVIQRTTGLPSELAFLAAATLADGERRR